MNLRKVQRVVVQGLRSFSTSLRDFGQLGATQPQETQLQKPHPAPIMQNVFMEPMQFQSSMLQETRKYSFGSQKSLQEEKKESLSMARASAYIIRYLATPQKYVPKGFYDDSFYDSYKTYEPNLSLYREGSVQGVTDRVLSDVLISELELKRQKLQLSQETIDYFKAMFNPRIGVPLPEYFKDQERIQDAFNSKFDPKDGQKVPQEHIADGRFSFFPFRLMTKYVFPMVMRTHGKQMLVGSKGSSKTTNFIFFSFLSHIVTRHIVEYGKSDEWKDLHGIPMLFYLTCPEKPQLEEMDVIERVLQQCPDKIREQISKEDLQNKKAISIYSFIRRKFKEYGIQTKVVVDQINRLAREVQSYNDNLKNRSKISDDLKRQKKIQMQDIIKIWCFHLKKLGRLMFNSSQNIQDEIMGYGPSVEYGVGLELHIHTQTAKIQVHYEIESNSDWGRKQITKYLTSQVLKRVSSKVATEIHQSNDSFKSFLRNMQSALQNDLRTKVLTPLAIRKLFQGKNDDLKSAPSVQKLQQYIKNKTRKLIESQLKQMRLKAERFIDESRQDIKIHSRKIQLNQKLFQFCSNLRQVKSKPESLSSDEKKAWNNGFVEVRESDIGLNEIFQDQKHFDSFDRDRVFELIDKDYFEVQLVQKTQPNNQQQQLKSSQSEEKNANANRIEGSKNQQQLIFCLKVHCDTYLQVLKNLPGKYKIFFRQNFKHVKRFLKANRSSLGSFYEEAMRNILKGSREQRSAITIFNESFPINLTSHFAHFSEQLISYSNIQAIIAKTPQGKVNFAQPISEPYPTSQTDNLEITHSQNSPSFDFIIYQKPVNDPMSNNKVKMIRSFDITINKNTSNKVKKAEDLLNKILNDVKYQNQEEIEEWIHIIYNPEMSSSKNKVLESGTIGTKRYRIVRAGSISVHVQCNNAQKMLRYEELKDLLQSQ